MYSKTSCKHDLFKVCRLNHQSDSKLSRTYIGASMFALGRPINLACVGKALGACVIWIALVNFSSLGHCSSDVVAWRES